MRSTLPVAASPLLSILRRPSTHVSRMTVNTVPHAPAAPGSAHEFSKTAAQLRSEYQSPNTSKDIDDQNSYVLTLRTDEDHFKSMNSLRLTYFPPKLNKIPAHIALFHALPESKLENEVLPAIREIAESTPAYKIRVSKPFPLGSNGIGIGVGDDIEFPKDGKNSRNMTRIVHAELRKKWNDWVSEQDKRAVGMHYTVLNKVDDKKVTEKAMSELSEAFKAGKEMTPGNFDHSGKDDKQDRKPEGNKIIKVGDVVGMTLWKYEKTGHWKDPQHFKFTAPHQDPSEQK